MANRDVTLALPIVCLRARCSTPWHSGSKTAAFAPVLIGLCGTEYLVASWHDTREAALVEGERLAADYNMGMARGMTGIQFCAAPSREDRPK